MVYYIPKNGILYTLYMVYYIPYKWYIIGSMRCDTIKQLSAHIIKKFEDRKKIIKWFQLINSIFIKKKLLKKKTFNIYNIHCKDVITNIMADKFTITKNVILYPLPRQLLHKLSLF